MEFKFALAVVSALILLPRFGLARDQCGKKSITSITPQRHVTLENLTVNADFPQIRYKLSARDLTARNRKRNIVKIDPYIRLYNNGRGGKKKPENDDKYCFIRETQNPDWTDTISINYESMYTYIEVEIRDNVEAGEDFSLGVAYVHAKNLLCVGRQVEYPLWNHKNQDNKNVDDLYTGYILVTTTYISDPTIIICD